MKIIQETKTFLPHTVEGERYADRLEADLRKLKQKTGRDFKIDRDRADYILLFESFEYEVKP